MLDNFEFHMMSVNSRAILPMLWLLASEDEDPTSGLIKDSYKKIAFRLRCSEKNITDAVKECETAGFLQVIEKQLRIESVHDSLRDSNQPVTPETETETEAEAEAEAEKDYQKLFDQFWDVYGKIGNKQQAKKFFNKAIKEGVDYETIINGVKKYQHYCQAIGQEQRFIRHASTWLNNRGWEDEYTVYEQPAKKNKSKHERAKEALGL
jgi:hypothetical protein